MLKKDKFKIFVGILILVSLFILSDSVPNLAPIDKPIPLPLPPPSFESSKNSISKENLTNHVKYLASPELDGRKPGEIGYKKAVEYVLKKWRMIKVIKQRVPAYNSDNVIGYIEGKDKNRIFVFGAHLDHLGNGYLGADDNASGSAAVIELGRIYSTYEGHLPCTILFQLYTAEEVGLKGSQYYCSNPLFPLDKPDIKKHFFMANADMIGHFGGLVGGSDHSSFARHGIPTKFYHTGTNTGDYHRRSDTWEKLNYDGMKSITEQMFELSWKKIHGNL